MVVRPDLALAGYDVVQRLWSRREEARGRASTEAQPQRRAIHDAALQPAVLLLCARGCWEEECASETSMKDFTPRFYEELRDLWRREREFDGGLFDIHTILFVLGSGCYRGMTWADAVSRPLVAELVREFEDATPDLHVSHVNAARLAARFLDRSRPDAPRLDLTLDEYGGRLESFCWIVEQGTGDYIRLRLRRASAHAVVRDAGGRGWRIHRSEGHTAAEAEQVFAQEVMPRLEELAAAARAFVKGLPTPPLTAARLLGYRAVDAKTFCLLVSGLDYEKARERLVGVLDEIRLATLGRLLRVDPMEIHRLSDFVEVQRRLGRALDSLPKDRRPTAHGLGLWSYADERGKVLCALLEGGARSAGAEEPEDDAVSGAAASIPAVAARSEPPAAADRNGMITEANVTANQNQRPRAAAVRATEPAIRILHLSDLHVGEDADPVALLQPLAADLEDRVDGLGIDRLDALVISGDISNHASAGELEKARELVSGLIARFGLAAERCILVPGNHDLDWNEPVYRTVKKRAVAEKDLVAGSYKEQGDLYEIRDDALYPNRFKSFSQCFYQPLLQRSYPLTPEQQCIAHLLPDLRLQFLALNSAWEIDEYFRDRSGIHSGALARGIADADAQVKRAQREGRLAPDAAVMRIAVWHHPITGNEKIQKDAFVANLQRAGVRLCLHGHVHEGRADLVGYLHPTRNVHVVGAGSFGAPARARPESIPRLYNVIELWRDHSRMRVHTRCLKKLTGAWEGWAEWPGAGPGERRTYYEVPF